MSNNGAITETISHKGTPREVAEALVDAAKGQGEAKRYEFPYVGFNADPSERGISYADYLVFRHEKETRVAWTVTKLKKGTLKKERNGRHR